MAAFVAAAVVMVAPVRGVAETDWLDPAAIVPSDTALFIQIDNLPAIRSALEDWSLLPLVEAQLPHRRNPEAWEALQGLLGLNEEQIIERYFGRTLLIAANDLNNTNAALLSRIEPADGALLVEKLNLEAERAMGPFTIYRSEDHGRIALSDRWLVIADARNASYTRQILSGLEPGDSLARHTPFTHTFSQLDSPQASVRFYTHNLVNNETHAAAAVLVDGRVTIDYLGRSAEIAKGLLKLGGARSIDTAALFGAEPPLASLSLNIHDEVGDAEAVALFDRLLAPKRFRTDVLPKLDPPITVFFDELDATTLARLPRPPGHPIPVLGLAVRLNDRAVAADLDNALNNLASFFNIMTLEWKTPPIVLRTVNTENGPYHVAEIGDAMAQRSGFGELKPIVRVTYGRVGDHYVITTHDGYFLKLIGTSSVNSSSETVAGVDAGALKGGKPFAGGEVSPVNLAEHIDAWLAHFRQTRPELMQTSEEPGAGGEAAEAMRNYQLIRPILRAIRSARFESIAAGAETLRARLSVTTVPDSRSEKGSGTAD